MTEGNGRRTRASDPPELPDVQEGQAPADVREVFEDIARTLRVPYVGLFWRVLASEPALLRAGWEAVAPNLRTRAAEDAATALRGHALIAEAAGISSHKAFRGDLVRAEIDHDLRTRISNFNHIAAYALPKHLLATAMLTEALEGRATGGGAAAAAGIPAGVAAGAVAVAPVDPRTARGRAAELLPQIAEGHGHPTTEDYFRSLARLPDYLGAAWNALRPIVRDEVYDGRGQELVRIATGAVRGLPHPVALPRGGLPPPQAGELAQLLRLFRDRMLPDTLIDAMIVIGLTDGPQSAQSSPYAV